MRLIDADKLEPSEAYMDGFTRIVYMDDIDEMPTIDAEPVRHGRWEAVEYGDGTVRTECSICGYGRCLPPVRNYCPNCGAKMDGERREGDAVSVED